MSNWENDIRKVSQRDIEIPHIVNEKLDEAYEKIRGEEIKAKRRNRKSRYRNIYLPLAAAACVVLVLSGIFYVNPALAKDIPVLGDVFARLRNLRDEHAYPEKDKTAYENIEKHSEPVRALTSIAEDAGIRMMITDAYCDGFDLYFTISLTAEDGELKTADRLELLSYREGDPVAFFAWLTVNGEEVYPSDSTISLRKSDENVYVALVRVQSMNTASGEFPENMTVGLDIGGVGAFKDNMEEIPDVPNYDRVGFKCVQGKWQMEFQPEMNTDDNRSAEPNAENNGIIVKCVTQTPSNMHLTMYLPKQWASYSTAIILTDENGNRVEDKIFKFIEQEDGSQIQEIVLDQSDASRYVLRVYDKNGDTGADGYPPLIAEIPFSME